MMRFIYLFFLLFIVAFCNSQIVVDALNVTPNPFVKRTVAYYSFSQNDTVTLNVYDRWGQLIIPLLTNSIKPSGNYIDSIKLDAFADGIYFTMLQLGSRKKINKQIVKISSSSTQSVSVINFMQPTCTNSCNASISFSINGVPGPYTVVMSGSTCPTSNTITFTSSTVTINNICYCDFGYNFVFSGNSNPKFDSIQGQFFAQFMLFASNSPISCMGACDATATVFVGSGGTAPYSYTWNPTGANTNTISNACAGSYKIKVKDSQNCESTTTLIMLNPSNPCVGINEASKESGYKIYPSITTDFLHIELEKNNFIRSTIEIINSLGQVVYVSEFKNKLDVSRLPTGLFYLKIVEDPTSIIITKFIKE